MKKHASSHGLAVLMCTVIGGILVKMGYDHYPPAVELLKTVSMYFIDFFNIEDKIRAVDAVSTLILATILAVIWGIAFSFMHSDNRKS